jgi:threonine dehydrogenase-like Zn-dependent dehydrogenase
MSILAAGAAGATAIIVIARPPHQAAAAARALGANEVFDSTDAAIKELGDAPVDCGAS